jgi:hypothetical protein
VKQTIGQSWIARKHAKNIPTGILGDWSDKGRYDRKHLRRAGIYLIFCPSFEVEQGAA